MAYGERIFSVSSFINLIQSENKETKDQSLTWNSTKSVAQSLEIRFSAVYDSSSSSPRQRMLKVARIPLPDRVFFSEESELEMPHLDPDAAANNRSISGSLSATTEDERSALPPPPSPQKAQFGLCYCRRDLLPVKLFYFSFHGALGVGYPYMSVFLKQIGLSAVQIGVIAGVRPVLGFISAPVWGSLADRFNMRRAMLIVSMLAWLFFFGGFYFLRAPDLMQAPFPQQPTLHRPHVRRRRTATSQQQQSFYDDVTLTTVADDNRSAELFRGNDSRCNYSDISAEDKELLKENLSWIYDPSSVYWTFIICLVIICGGELFQAPTTALTDAATLQVLGRENIAQYGAQRAWGPIGWAISSLSVGYLLNANRSTQTVCGIDLNFSDYRIIAYVFMAIMVFGLAAAFAIDFGAPSRPDDLSSSKGHSTLAVVKLFLNIHYGSWILTTFFVGLLNGIIWGFVFWHLDNLGGTQLLMGVDSVVMCMFEFTSFFFVDHVIRRVGHMGIMYIGLLGYAVRFLVYASITNPWLVLPADALQGVTFSFIWVSITSYTAIAVPSVSLATVQGLVHGVYFGLGNGLGHLIGGLLIGNYGAVATFYSFAVATAVWLLFFALCQKVYLQQWKYHKILWNSHVSTSCTFSTKRRQCAALHQLLFELETIFGKEFFKFSKKPSNNQFSYQDISGPD